MLLKYKKKFIIGKETYICRKKDNLFEPLLFHTHVGQVPYISAIN